MTGRRYPQRGLHGEVVERIAMRILRGDLRPGQALPNADDLSLELKVSRTLTREAIKVLAAKGLLESRPKTGTRVRPRSDWSLLDPDVLAWTYQAKPDTQFLRNVTELRRIVEPAAAALAASRATGEDLSAMAVAYDEMRARAKHGVGFIEADISFHAAIVSASHNELLDRMTSAISAGLSVSGKVTRQLMGAASASMPLHYAVLEAVQRKSPGTAETAMQQLIRRASTNIERALRTQSEETA
jgi:DNA-binding FadR family transcriptional regulator